MRPGSRAITAEELESVERIEAMGYVSGSMPVPDAHGVLFHDKEQAYQGLNLYVSGHAPEALLMDMAGKSLHTWRYDFYSAWPKYPKDKAPNHWRRAHLYPNGELIANYGGAGLIKIDKDSKLLWKYGERVHHDLDVHESGVVYTLIRKGERIPALSPSHLVVMDYIVLLSPEGEELRRISLFDCFADSDFKPVIKAMKKRGDILHTNTIEILDGAHVDKDPAFKKDNLLLSFRNLSSIAVVDPEAEKVVWYKKGAWRYQHQPTFTPDGSLILFDNSGLGERSRVLEFDPATMKETWAYGNGPDELFFTRLIGSAQRLANGNTLITESDNGRVFEVTPEKNIVWEFVTPKRAGAKEEFIASVYELIRLAPGFPLDWLEQEK